MKIIVAIAASLMIMSSNAINLSVEESLEKGGKKSKAAKAAKKAAKAAAKAAPFVSNTSGGDPEDEWITIPPQKLSVDDKYWGHEVQRLGHFDWLDDHVKTV